jgi:hypothetical protein
MALDRATGAADCLADVADDPQTTRRGLPGRLRGSPDRGLRHPDAEQPSTVEQPAAGRGRELQQSAQRDVGDTTGP